MANSNTPFGLRVKGPLLSAKLYKMGAAYATTLYRGDPVVLNNAGNIVIATAGTGNAILGAALGFYDTDQGILTTSYYVGATAGIHWCLVADDPRQLYVVQEDSVGGNLALVDLGQNSVLAAGAGGSAISGRSSWMIDSSAALAATAGDQIRLIDIYRSPDNAVGAYCKWVIRLNNAQGAAGIVGVGI